MAMVTASGSRPMPQWRRPVLWFADPRDPRSHSITGPRSQEQTVRPFPPENHAPDIAGFAAVGVMRKRRDLEEQPERSPCSFPAQRQFQTGDWAYWSFR